MHFLTRHDMILQTYVYSRNAAQSSYYNKSMTKHLWDIISAMLEKLETTPKPHETKTKDNAKSDVYNWCKSDSLNINMDIFLGKTHFLLKDISVKQARKIAKDVISQHKDDPEEDLKDLISAEIARL